MIPTDDRARQVAAAVRAALAPWAWPSGTVEIDGGEVDEAVAAVSKAVSVLLADAWDEGYGAAERDEESGYTDNPYRDTP